MPASIASARPRVVIIGCGFGALFAARRLAHAPVDVTVVDRTHHHLFQPLLYPVATAGLAAPSIGAPRPARARAPAQHDDADGRSDRHRHARARGRARGRLAACLRLPDRRAGRNPQRLRSSRMGAARAGAQGARRRVRDPPPRAARLRARRTRARFAGARALAHADRHRCGRHRRRDGENDGRNRTPHAAARVQALRPEERAGDPARRRRARATRQSARFVDQGAAAARADRRYGAAQQPRHARGCVGRGRRRRTDRSAHGGLGGRRAGFAARRGAGAVERRPARPRRPRDRDAGTDGAGAA